MQKQIEYTISTLEIAEMMEIRHQRNKFQERRTK